MAARQRRGARRIRRSVHKIALRPPGSGPSMSGFAPGCRPSLWQERSIRFEPHEQPAAAGWCFDPPFDRSTAMNAKTVRIAAALLATGLAASAHAEYRCDPAPSWVDRAACKAAEQGPNELRRFVEAMNSIRINIRFEHYVNAALARQWDQSRNVAERAAPASDAPQVASVAPR
jgi:hypothetical protein